MKRLINYFTPVGAEQIAFAKALMVVVTAIVSQLGEPWKYTLFRQDAVSR